jgi:glucosamine kinase
MSKKLNDIVIGIDGGGTHTRVMVADSEGNVLSYIEKGASSIHKDLQSKLNVHQAIQEALQQAGKEISEVVSLVRFRN